MDRRRRDLARCMLSVAFFFILGRSVPPATARPQAVIHKELGTSYMDVNMMRLLLHPNRHGFFHPHCDGK